MLPTNVQIRLKPNYGRDISILAHVSLPDHTILILEFIDEEKIMGVMYLECPDGDSTCEVIGFGLLGKYVGKGYGEILLVESLRFLNQLIGVVGIRHDMMGMNELQRRFWRRMLAENKHKVKFLNGTFGFHYKIEIS